MGYSMRPARLLVPVTAAVALLCAATAPASGADSVLQSDVNALRAAGNVGVIAESNDRGFVTTAKAGVAQVGTTTPVPDGAHYRVGSITKPFVAVTTLQLIGEGRLSLDDTVDRWLPGLINRNGNDGTKITVKMLLQHTSGLPDYDDDPTFAATISTPQGFLANRGRHYEPIDLINIGLSHPPTFAPGTGWSYSNTGYIVLGEIIRAATGNHWTTEVTNRIINPLGLADTYSPGTDPTITRSHANGYHMFTTNARQRAYTDTTDHEMSWGGAAGELITTTADQNKFFSALMKGQLLQPAQFDAMRTTIPIPGSTSAYGLGIIVTKMCGSAMWWHSGGVMGYASLSGSNVDGSLTVAMNSTTTSFTDTTYISENDRARDALTRHVFCGPRYSGTESLSAETTKITGTRSLR